jgi:DNA modification methylase
MKEFKEIGIRNLKLEDSEVLKSLKKLGKLHKEFKDQDLLLKLFNSENKNIRYYSINNLAKLNNEKLLKKFEYFLKKEKTSYVRREIASAIGRLRSKKAIPIMKKLLEDSDPNIILQAVRGLLIFKDDDKIRKILEDLKDHQNEIVQKIINIEFFDNDEYLSKQHESPNYLQNCIAHGDVLKLLKKVNDESIHLTFTSPPYYNARDYSIYNSYQSYLEFLWKTFKEVHRITKEGRFLILNTSPIIIPRTGRKYSSIRYPIPFDIHSEMIKMGWEYVDDIVWLKPEPSAKNRVAGFNLHRKPLAYKPNCVTETLMVYRKKSNKLIDWIFKQYPKSIVDKSKVKDGYETSNVWKIDPSSDKNHSAVFPIKLCDKVINYYSFEGDLVFDPFAGSGSVGLSAIKNNRYFFLTEINKVYFDILIEKFKSNLFDDVKVGINQE